MGLTSFALPVSDSGQVVQLHPCATVSDIVVYYQTCKL